MLDKQIAIAPLAAFVIGLCAVPAVRRLALAHGFLDNPDRRRKFQGAPIALGGGIAVWVATWLGWGVGMLGFRTEIEIERDVAMFIAALGFSSFWMLCLGFVDDRLGMRARYKLAGQMVPAVILVILGVRIDAWRCFGVELQLGIFAYPVTVFWILLVVNAFNLIDGMDGFCGSLGLIASLAIGFIAYAFGRVEDTVFALALAGSLAAFLRFNLPPAKIYLGDAGSMTIGLVISVLAVRSCSDEPRTAVFVLPMISLVMLPLLDIVTAAGRRWLKGNSIFAADRGHIHHCMKSRLGSVVAALAAAVSLATIGAAGAALAMAYDVGDPVVCCVIASSVGLLIGTKTFGATEWRLLFFRLNAATSPLSAGHAVRGSGIGRECHLHGKRDWAGVWNRLVREGEASGVWRIDLAIELAAAGELYHARWSSPTATQDEPHWSIVHTLYAGETVAGMISVSGSVDECGSPYLDKVERLVRVVEDRLVGDDVRLLTAEKAPLVSMNRSIKTALT